MSTPQKAIADLIKNQNVEFLSDDFSNLEPYSKAALVKWLEGENFPTDNPPDLVGNEFVRVWLPDKSQLLIFRLDYEEEEQCGGSILFSVVGEVCTHVTDTVECSS